MDNLNADSEVLYTIAEVASLLKVNKNMVYQLCLSNENVSKRAPKK